MLYHVCIYIYSCFLIEHDPEPTFNHIIDKLVPSNIVMVIPPTVIAAAHYWPRINGPACRQTRGCVYMSGEEFIAWACKPWRGLFW